MSFWRRNRNIICRAACTHFFCLEGMLTGVWASQLPNIQDRSNLSDGVLGLCVLCVYLGTVLATPTAGFLNRLLGSKWATITSAMLYILSLPIIGIKADIALLITGMFLFGITMGSYVIFVKYYVSFVLGLMDVSMNACGVVAELVADKPLMGSFHGSYSIAAALSSVLGSGLASINWTPLEIFSAVCSVSVLTTLMAGGGLYKWKDEAYYSSKHWKLLRRAETGMIEPMQETLHSMKVSSQSEEDSTQRLVQGEQEKEDSSLCQCAVPRNAALYLCAVGFLASYGEGAMVTWSVIYFKRYVDTPRALATVGFFTFMVCMAVGRFSCDYIRRKVGRRRLVRVAGILAGVGLLLTVAAPSLPLNVGPAVCGLALTGAGLSTLIPTVFSSAGHLPGTHSGTSIATAAAFTYCGSIVSPPMVGGLSDGMDSLRWAFLVVAIILSVIAPLSYGVPPELVVETKDNSAIDGNSISCSSDGYSIPAASDTHCTSPYEGLQNPLLRYSDGTGSEYE